MTDTAHPAQPHSLDASQSGPVVRAELQAAAELPTAGDHAGDERRLPTTQATAQPFAHPPNPATAPPRAAVGRQEASVRRGTKIQTSFFPTEPETLQATGLSTLDIESLIVKYLQAVGSATGRQVAEQLRLPFRIIQPVLAGLKLEFFVEYRNSGPMNDYEYRLTEDGVKRARVASQKCTYFGAAPVTLLEYVESVRRQSIRHSQVRLGDLRTAFRDLILPTEVLGQIGQAINAGRGLLMYGPPGNGKSSVAERIMRSLNQYIWIPRTVAVTGDLIRIFDPSFHQEVKLPGHEHLIDELSLDRRWVLIRRPTVVVGGELTMSQLEISSNPLTGVQEAPIQLKSNGGALVVDDLGRQRFSPAEMMNRWIIPLEKGYDFLTLNSGRQISVPFDQVLVMATNLDPRELADEAVLRRLHYKIELIDPTVEQFHDLLQRAGRLVGVQIDNDAIEYLIDTHYRQPGRAFRFCHARDLLQQVRVYCEFYEQPVKATTDALDIAAKNYFAGLSG